MGPPTHSTRLPMHPQLPPFERPYITSYKCSVVTTSMSCTISKILPLLRCMSLSVTFRRPSESIKQLKLPATCIFLFMCKHIVVSKCYIPNIWDLENYCQLQWRSQHMMCLIKKNCFDVSYLKNKTV